jgi:hypothetical protein
MKSTFTVSLAILTLLVSCSKHNSTGSTGTTPPPTSPGTTMTINLATIMANQEIIISDSGGKVLLDTIPTYPATLTATLATAQTLLDVTLVYLIPNETNYTVTTYKAVNPSKWTSLGTDYLGPNGEAAPYPAMTPANASVVYKNTPSIPYGSFYLDDYVNGISPFNVAPVGGYLDVTYPSYQAGNSVYLLFPWAGLYNFHIPQTPADTVDLSTMDTVTTINYIKPAGYNDVFTALYGIMDTMDLSKTLNLYFVSEAVPLGLPDVEYPRTQVQKLQLLYSFSVGSDYIYYYSYGNTIASSLTWPSESNYEVSSSLANNFAITFNGTQPSRYATTWNCAKAWFTLYASPDSTNTNPQAILSSLNSKLCPSQNLSSPTLSGFYFESTPGLDYAGIFALQHNPALLKAQPITSNMQFFKTF